MSTHFRIRAELAVAVAAAMLFAAVASAKSEPRAELERVGATAIVYRGPQVDVALSYRFAKYNPNGNWLLLETVMTAESDPVDIPRGAIAVRTPTGEVVPLAPQALLAEDYGSLASAIARADVIREPLGYLTPRRFRPMRLFAQYGPGIAFPTVWLDQWHNDYGRLFFRLPDGVRKGNYELLINLPEGKVVMPFAI